jgi:hypothetical protein
MMRMAPLALALAAALATPATAEDAATGSAARDRRLDLDRWIDGPAESPVAFLTDGTPRFEERIEVRGKARDPASLKAKMNWFLGHADLRHGAVAGNASAPSVADMAEFRPGMAPNVDFARVIGWVVDEIRKRTRD